MTADVNDVLVVVVCFIDFTKPACLHLYSQEVSNSRELFISNKTLVTYWSVDFQFIIRIYVFFRRIFGGQ